MLRYVLFLCNLIAAVYCMVYYPLLFTLLGGSNSNSYFINWVWRWSSYILMIIRRTFLKLKPVLRKYSPDVLSQHSILYLESFNLCFNVVVVDAVFSLYMLYMTFISVSKLSFNLVIFFYELFLSLTILLMDV